MTLRDVIRDRIKAKPNHDDTATARAILRAADVPRKAEELLLDLVANEVWSVRRAHTRSMERKLFRRNVGNEAADPLGARMKLLAETFALPDGRRVAWGEATIDDHRERIEMLNKLAGGINETISRHEQSIADIVAAGVKCLAEIEGMAAAA